MGTAVTMEVPKTIKLPPLEELWKWPRAVNPHLPEIGQECLDWSASFGVWPTEKQKLKHEGGNLNLLAAMCFPRASREHVRSACDMMHLFFIFDDVADRSSPDVVWHHADITIDAMRHPDKPRPKGEWVGAEMARQFWLRLPKATTATCRRRFLATWSDYAASVAREAEHRTESRILDVEIYVPLRRNTIGALPVFALWELDMDIPDDVREHPTLRKMVALGAEIIAIDNDILSYNKEQANHDDAHNIVTIFMTKFGLDIQQAVDKTGELIRDRTERFESLYRQLPRWFGPVGLDVQKLVDGIAQCVSGCMHWSYESRRYFGTDGLVVKESRTVDLLPKVNA